MIELETKVSDLPTKAKVECPKKTGEMDGDTSCKKCGNYSACIIALGVFMGR